MITHHTSVSNMKSRIQKIAEKLEWNPDTQSLTRYPETATEKDMITANHETAAREEEAQDAEILSQEKQIKDRKDFDKQQKKSEKKPSSAKTTKGKAVVKGISSDKSATKAKPKPKSSVKINIQTK